MGVAMAIGEGAGIVLAGVLGDPLGVVNVLNAQGALYLLAGLLAVRLLVASAPGRADDAAADSADWRGGRATFHRRAAAGVRTGSRAVRPLAAVLPGGGGGRRDRVRRAGAAGADPGGRGRYRKGDGAVRRARSAGDRAGAEPSTWPAWRGSTAPVSGVEIVETEFERWEPTEPLSALVSAAAWHWIAPDVRFEKAHRALAPGGTLAAIWSLPDWERCSLRALAQRCLPRHRTGAEARFPDASGQRAGAAWSRTGGRRSAPARLFRARW